jgi:hypothetical protein
LKPTATFGRRSATRPGATERRLEFPTTIKAAGLNCMVTAQLHDEEPNFHHPFIFCSLRLLLEIHFLFQDGTRQGKKSKTRASALTFLSRTRGQRPWNKEGRRRKAPSAFASKTGPTSPPTSPGLRRARRRRRLQRSCYVSIVAHGPIPPGLAMSTVERPALAPGGAGAKEKKNHEKG